MHRINPAIISYSLDDIIIRPGWTPSSLTYEDVDLSVQLADDVVLRYPFIAAAMSCVTGRDMALACANNGIMAVVPCSLPIEEEAEIVSYVKSQEVKEGELEFQDHPSWMVCKPTERRTIGDAVERYNQHGHSTLPVGDDFRRLLGIFRYREGIPTQFYDVALKDAMEALQRGDESLGELSGVLSPFDLDSAEYWSDYCWDTETPDNIHRQMIDHGIRCLPVLGEDGTLQKLAFIYKFNGYAIGAAIHTHRGWKRRADALLEAGADIIFIDASDAKTDYQAAVIREFKKRYPGQPVCGGNIIDAEGYERLVEAGADLVKVGMGTGSSCITSDRRGIGRGMATALDDISEEKQRNPIKVPIIADGGIGARRVGQTSIGTSEGATTLSHYAYDPSRIIKSLIWADGGVMMGTFFNMMEQSPGTVFEHNGRSYKPRWGEGSFKAQSLRRYGVGEMVRRAFIEEGISDYVNCAGRLKPLIERMGLNLQVTLVNMGAKDLAHYREEVVDHIEIMTPSAKRDAGIK